MQYLKTQYTSQSQTVWARSKFYWKERGRGHQLLLTHVHFTTHTWELCPKVLHFSTFSFTLPLQVAMPPLSAGCVSCHFNMGGLATSARQSWMSLKIRLNGSHSTSLRTILDHVPRTLVEPTVDIHTHEILVSTLPCRHLNQPLFPTSPSSPDEVWDCVEEQCSFYHRAYPSLT